MSSWFFALFYHFFVEHGSNFLSSFRGSAICCHAQNSSHGIGWFFLCRGSDMGVGVQSESSGEVAQHPGDRFDVYAVLEGYPGFAWRVSVTSRQH